MKMIYLNKTRWSTLWQLKQGDHICTTVISAFGQLNFRATESETHFFVCFCLCFHNYP